MTKNDWQEAGDQFKKLIQDAVDSNDFSKLGSTLTNVVNDTVNGLQSALQDNLSKAQQTASQKAQEAQQTMSQSARKAQETVRDKYQYTNSEAAERIRRNLQEKRAAARQNGQGRKLPARIKAPGEFSGNVMKWTGYSMGGMFGFSAAILGIISLGTGVWMAVPTGILLLLFGITMGLGARGSRKVQLAKRFRRYMTVLGDRTYCLVEELASAVGQSNKFVKKDLKKMISRGFFKEGYLDGRETMLITDRSTYQQYLSAQTEYEKRRMAREEGGAAYSGSSGQPGRDGAYAGGNGGQPGRDGAYAGGNSGRPGKDNAYAGGNGAGMERDSAWAGGSSDRAERDGSYAGGGGSQAERNGARPESSGFQNKKLTPECREILEEGYRYIQHIHECNEKIPGEEISAKLDRLELVVTKIFHEMEKNPSIAGDLKKLMSYYLPTTTKLLDAYCEMDAQPIVGRNIENTKKEIEDALDTINTAFENLLDSLFQDEAWDISSDITVLHTMLAQEGLAGNDFAHKQGGK